LISPDKYKSSGKKESYSHIILSKKKHIHHFSSSSKGIPDHSSSESYDEDEDEDGEEEYSSSDSFESEGDSYRQKKVKSYYFGLIDPMVSANSGKFQSMTYDKSGLMFTQVPHLDHMTMHPFIQELTRIN
jgi:hypothetical protein